MEYVVLETGGKQYKVSTGDTLEVESLKVNSGSFSFDKVLLHVVDGKVNVGTPYIAGFSVTAKILGATKGEKIHVSKFKGKSRYRKTTGHRQSLTKVEVVSFGEGKKAVASKKSASKE